MKRLALCAVGGFVAGCVLTWLLLCARDRPRSVEEMLSKSDITIQRQNRPDQTGVPFRLKPHTYTDRTTGATTKLGEPVDDPNRLWIITLDNGRIVLGAHPQE
jgi:hypothetical protein